MLDDAVPVGRVSWEGRKGGGGVLNLGRLDMATPRASKTDGRIFSMMAARNRCDRLPCQSLSESESPARADVNPNTRFEATASAPSTLITPLLASRASSRAVCMPPQPQSTGPPARQEGAAAAHRELVRLAQLVKPRDAILAHAVDEAEHRGEHADLELLADPPPLVRVELEESARCASVVPPATGGSGHGATPPRCTSS